MRLAKSERPRLRENDSSAVKNEAQNATGLRQLSTDRLQEPPNGHVTSDPRKPQSQISEAYDEG